MVVGASPCFLTLSRSSLSTLELFYWPTYCAWKPEMPTHHKKTQIVLSDEMAEKSDKASSDDEGSMATMSATSTPSELSQTVLEKTLITTICGKWLWLTQPRLLILELHLLTQASSAQAQMLPAGDNKLLIKTQAGWSWKPCKEGEFENYRYLEVIGGGTPRGVHIFLLHNYFRQRKAIPLEWSRECTTLWPGSCSPTSDPSLLSSAFTTTHWKRWTSITPAPKASCVTRAPQFT